MLSWQRAAQRLWSHVHLFADLNWLNEQTQRCTVSHFNRSSHYTSRSIRHIVGEGVRIVLFPTWVCVCSCVRFVLTCGRGALRNDRCVTALHFILSLFRRCHWNNLKLHVFVTVSHWRRRWQPASQATRRKLSLTTEAKEYVGTFTCPGTAFTEQLLVATGRLSQWQRSSNWGERACDAASAASGLTKHSDYLGRHLSDNRLISVKVIVFLIISSVVSFGPDLCC